MRLINYDDCPFYALYVIHFRSGDGGTRKGFAASRKKLFKRFRTSFDHILLTVSGTPHRKEFVNANAERVWVTGK